MAATTLRLDLLTPMGPLRQGIEVGGVEVPGLLGEIGVLPQHEAFVTAVKPGVVRFREGVSSVRIAVGSGFLEVTPEGRVAILVERAKEIADIDTASVRRDLDRIKADLDQQRGSIDAAEFRTLSSERDWLQAQLRAAEG